MKMLSPAVCILSMRVTLQTHGPPLPTVIFAYFQSAAAADGKRRGCGTVRVSENNAATQGPLADGK
jgi:hypothetical protein